MNPTLPYLHQVQDVSLIFQSAMATSIAAMCTAAGYAPEEALGTVLTTLVIATFVVGVLIVAVGGRARPSQGCARYSVSEHHMLCQSQGGGSFAILS